MEKPDIPETTIELLRVAVTKSNQYSNIVARNYSVIACLTMGEKLLEISQVDSRSQRTGDLMRVFGIRQAPASFLVLAAGCLRGVHDRISQMMRRANTTDIPITTDFDGHAISALGLCLSDIMWTEKQPGLPSGPSPDVGMDRYAKQTVASIRALFTQHYLGNILQYYFEKAGLRRDPQLRAAIPANEESILRDEHARVIAHACVQTQQARHDRTGDVFDFVDVLTHILFEITRI
ncbi:MAG TPA: hypothetical protein VHE34_16760 [Puia sp.]|uniref:hypothetical protein n=1 Tax=Puia sp. TaxID=2045100 RepID=UPI002C9DCCD1|nr:hypothetical protein [Puia sp.]HVU96884.1 hypothetical protein [Puia sp.]